MVKKEITLDLYYYRKRLKCIALNEQLISPRAD